MLGTNPLRPQELEDGTQLWVQELFYTLQGEGPFAGRPAVFLRLAGCNLCCYFCDTDFESSQWHPTLDEIIGKIEGLSPAPTRFVVITGGEPFRQNITPLVTTLLEKGYAVQIETNGTLWVDLPEHEDLHIVVSPKTGKLNENIRRRATHYKYVLLDGAIDDSDGLPLMYTQPDAKVARLARPDRRLPVFVMPMDSGSDEANTRNTRACVETSKRFGYTLTLQLHKILNIP